AVPLPSCRAARRRVLLDVVWLLDVVCCSTSCAARLCFARPTSCTRRRVQRTSSTTRVAAVLDLAARSGSGRRTGRGVGRCAATRARMRAAPRAASRECAARRAGRRPPAPRTAALRPPPGRASVAHGGTSRPRHPPVGPGAFPLVRTALRKHPNSWLASTYARARGEVLRPPPPGYASPAAPP